MHITAMSPYGQGEKVVLLAPAMSRCWLSNDSETRSRCHGGGVRLLNGINAETSSVEKGPETTSTPPTSKFQNFL